MDHNTIQMSHHVAWKQDSQISVHCPVTGEQAKMITVETVIFDGQAKWWRCSVCGGWHLVITDKGKFKR